MFGTGKVNGGKLYRRHNQAQAALHFSEERFGKELRNLIDVVRKWAER
jgi:hypothetical protein